MVNGDKIDLEKVVDVPEKPVVSDDTPYEVVQYHSRVFEVPVPMLFYLSSLPERIAGHNKIAEENGLENIDSDGGFGCMYCNHYEHNIANMYEKLKSGGAMTHNVKGETGVFVDGCWYRGIDGIVWASEFADQKSGKVKLAARTPCAMYDAMITDLVDSRSLDEFEVFGKTVDYPTIKSLLHIPEWYRSSTTGLVPKRNRLFRDVYEIVKELFRWNNVQR
ncbi:MAG: hypothetical protein V1729_04195 [Candidatus Woesearchaeota archaeon]